MEKILDLADVFALGDNFNVLHVLPIIVVIGGVVAVFIFGIKKSDGGEQFKKGITITKSVNVIKQKKKRTEGGGGSPKEPKTTATDLNKSKEKKSNQQQVVQPKKTKTSSPKEEKVAAPKKSSSTQAVGAKNQKSSQQKTKTKENNAKNANPIQNADAADGEWHTVTTKRQQKKVTTEQVVTKKEQKSSKADQLSKISLPTLPTAKGTFPKLEDVIAAMSSNSNFELSDTNKTAETSERPQRKTKSRALRE